MPGKYRSGCSQSTIVSTMQFTDMNLPTGTNSGCCVSHSRIKGANDFVGEIYVSMIKISVVR